MKSSIGKIMTATAIYAGVHSALASRAAKKLASRIFGDRTRNGLYRGFYNVQALVTFALLYAYARRLPDRTLYEIKGPAKTAMHAGQIATLVWAVWAAKEVGATDILGIRPFADYVRRTRYVAPEPEAQGPRRDVDHMRATGPFRLSRHPLNVAPVPIFWLSPTMTDNLLAFNVIMTIYMVVGSLHEEQRLRAAYGETYEEYEHSDVPFYVPRPKSA